MKKHPLANCDECPYNDRAHKFVPTKGGTGEIAFVGLAPGKYEARQGEPFVGASGKLVNILLESQNLRRDDITLTNAVACHPPKNEEPPKAAIRACSPRLLAELEGHDTVLAMGNVAAQSLLHTRTGITKLRVGPGRESDLLPGTRIIPTIHPAACLRNADSFPSLLHDVSKITHEPPLWVEPKFKVAENTAQALALIAAIDRRLQELGKDELIVDIETDFDKDVVVDHAENITLVGLCYEPHKVVEFPDIVLNYRVWERLRWLFNKYKLIAHNGKFDLVTVWEATGYRFRLFGDTMLAHYTLDERGGIHDLEQMSVELIGSPFWKHRQDEEPYLYNAYDCANEYDLWELLKTRMEAEGTRGLHDFLISASNAFMRMEYEKIRIDLAYNDQLEQELKDALLEMIEEFPDHDGGGKDINGHVNPNSPAQVQRWFEEKGLRVISTDKDVLKLYREDPRAQDRIGKLVGTEVRDEINGFIDRLLAYRKESKLLGTYVTGARKRLKNVDMLQPTYTLHMTTSGRPSCRNPNLQNIPIGSKIKTQFVPTIPGNVFVHVDYSQAELRLIAFFSKDEALRYMFEETSRDPFDELTVRIYGQLQDKDTFQYKEERVKTKTFAYGVAYGMEYGSVAKRFNMREIDAKREHSKFLDAIPDVVKWQAATRQAVLDGEDLMTPFGRHRRFWLITNENKKDILNEALAFKPQSTASDICVSAFIQLERDGIHLRNIIHDALLAECRPDEASDVAKHMQDVMTKAAIPVVGNYVTFKTEATVGNSWGDV